jgi:hypothetical protein
VSAWPECSRWLMFALGALAVIVVLCVSALVWLLTHPLD